MKIIFFIMAIVFGLMYVTFHIRFAFFGNNITDGISALVNLLWFMWCSYNVYRIEEAEHD